MRSAGADRGGRAGLVAALAVAIIAAAVIAWLWMRGPAPPGAPEGQPVAEAFLAAIRAGNPDEAWQSTTAEFKSAEGRESFRRYVAKNAALKGPLELVAVQTVTIGELPRSEFLYRPVGDATGKAVKVLVGEELGELRVDRVLVE